MTMLLMGAGVPAGDTHPGSNLLLEDGFTLLLEDGIAAMLLE